MTPGSRTTVHGMSRRAPRSSRRDRLSLRTFLIIASVTCGLLLFAAPPQAVASTPVDDAERVLSTDSLYVDPGVQGVNIDRAQVRSAIPGGVKIAVLPTDVGSPSSVATQIGRTLDPTGQGLTVGVFTANTSSYAFGAASSAYCEGYADAKAGAAEAANRTQLRQTHDITALLQDFARSVATGPKANTSACGAAAGGGSAKKSSGGASVWWWILGIGVVGAVGISALVWYRRRRRRRELELARAKVMPYYDRLASEVSNIDPKDDDTAMQAMADASERYAAAGAQLDTADSVEKYAIARRTTLEGLYAAVTARKALGLDPGPELPPIDDARGEQLSEPREVAVGGNTYQGYPNYTPGAPYYYGGGYGVPGGWYATPFWETLLIGSVLGGAFGGWGGGGYGAGYDSGFDRGYEAGRDSDTGGSGDWGGGDWGSGGGGGDWGGGGGGDWGGGGGGDSGGSW